MSRAALTVAGLVFTVLCLVPLGVMLARVGPSDLAGLAEARTASLLGRTLILGLGASGTALLLGLPYGFLVARTDLPGRAFLRTAGVVPLLLPPLFLAMTWDPLVALRGAPATILVLGFSTFPLVSVFAARASERIDARREEAARLAGGRAAVLRTAFPLILPPALCGACFAFAFAVNDFAVPDYVSSVGVKFNVYADEVFSNWSQTKEPGKAVASALPLMALVLAALVPALALRRRGAMASLGGDFRSPETLALGPWRWPAALFTLAVLTLSAGVPLGRMLWEASSGPALWKAPATEGGAGVGAVLVEQLAAFRRAFAEALDRSHSDLANSLLYSISAATLCVPLGLVLGHAIERLRTRRPRLGRGLEFVTVLPIAAPAILLGIGEIVTWNHAWSAGFYGSGALVVALMMGRYAAFAVLISAGATASFHPALEESAALAGAGPVRRLACIVAPGLRGSLIGGWVLVFLFSMRELDAAILVPAANHTAMFRAFNAVHFGRDGFVFALCLLLVFAITLPGLLWTLFARRRLEVLP